MRRPKRHTLITIVLALLTALVATGAQRDAYQRGQQALDRRDWTAAVAAFDEAVAGGGDKADDALYWKASALGKLGRTDDALRALSELRRRFPGSPWIDDAEALQAELRGASDPRAGGDDELKLLALAALAGSDDPRVTDVVTRFIRGNRPVEQKERALFVLMQSGAPGAFDAVAEVATDASNPELQAVAVRQLGIVGDERASATLQRIYSKASSPALRVEVMHAFMVSGDESPVVDAARDDASAEVRQAAVHMLGVMGATGELNALYDAESDTAVRETILQAFMIAGDRSRVLQAARSEPTKALRLQAVSLLGVMDGRDDLMTLWREEQSPDVREAIIQGLAISGAADELATIAAGDADESVRADAIRAMGIAGTPDGAKLVGIYNKQTTVAMHEAVLDALFMAGDVDSLLQIARSEKDPALKAAVVRRLAMTGSDKATDFMMEVLGE